MAEVDSVLQYSDFRDQSGRELGFGVSAPTGDALTMVDRKIAEAEDMCYTPPHLPGQSMDAPTHQWGWLYPLTTILLWPAEAAADAVTASGGAYANSVTPITLTGGTTFHPSMVRQTIHFVTADVDFVIAKYTSTSVVSVVGDASAISGDTFTVAAGQYGMADDFDGIEETLSVDAPTRSRSPILIVDENRVRRAHNTSINRLGFPREVAFVPRYDVIQLVSGTTYDQLHRWDMVVAPVLDQDYTLKFRYRFRRNRLSTSNAYPPGGPQFSRLLMAACLARCELERFKTEGVRFNDFFRVLAATIAEDRRAVGPEYIGRMWPGHDRGNTGAGFMHNDTTLIVTIDGDDPS